MSDDTVTEPGSEATTAAETPPEGIEATTTTSSAPASAGASEIPEPPATPVLDPTAGASAEPKPDYKPREQVTVDDVGMEDLEAEIAATISEFDEGDIVEGTIVRVERDEALLDIGFKSEGVIPAKELSIRQDVDPSEIVSVGDHVEALVLQKEDKDGRLILSKKRAQYERAWGNIEKVKDSGGVVKGPVIEVVKGGLIVDIGLRGFLPASLVELRRVRDLLPYVGRELECKIIELDKNRNNVVLSRRAWLEETQKEQREDFLHNLKPGERRKGVVSSVVNFGAFIDLGGMDGLVHVSELSWKHVDHPGTVVQVGDEVDVEVLEVDLSRERISLSLKATQEDPWEAFAREYGDGQIIEGNVTKLVPFGAFISVADGIEGLVHISEMAEYHVEQPQQVVSIGQKVSVKVIDVDLNRRRISLSMKQTGVEQGVATLAPGAAPYGAAQLSEESRADLERLKASLAEDAGETGETAEESSIEPAADQPKDEAAEVSTEPAAEVSASVAEVAEPEAVEQAEPEEVSAPAEPAEEIGELLSDGDSAEDSLESIMADMKEKGIGQGPPQGG
ncbi:MAG: 30S ribosomal protein S1 [Acidobacteria bacterium]|nr:MAG: 30S ribosomal protein S1 [Acidobacteriota bacterium]